VFEHITGKNISSHPHGGELGQSYLDSKQLERSRNQSNVNRAVEAISDPLDKMQFSLSLLLGVLAA
jgi:hypothetical protein